MAPTTKRKFVVCRDIGDDAMRILRDGLLDLEKDWDLIFWPSTDPAPREWILKSIPGAEGILVTLQDKIDEEFLSTAGTNLKVVSTMSVGYDHVDVYALTSRGVKLGYTPDVLTNAVADLAVMLALMTTRNVGEALAVVSTGKWPSFGWNPFALCGPQIGAGASGQKPYTVGFLGFGRIAKATLRRLAPFGVSRCLYSNTSSSGAPAPLPPSDSDKALGKELKISEIYAVPKATLAKESDLIIVLAPGGKETFHVIDEAFLRGMKETAVFVNVSRGTLVDTDALCKALSEKWIWGAGLDVVEGEPDISADHPLVIEPRAILLPHIGSATLDTRTEMASLAARNLVNGLLEFPLERELKF